mgnify:CR=1 FL=1|jgi:hypothetical protein
MTFKSKGAIFKNTPEKLQQRLGDRYDASKPYPDVDGLFSIKEEDRMAFASYIMNADTNEKGEIPVRITGYNNTSQNGVKYLGLTIEPDFKTQKRVEEKFAAAQAAQNGAESLAQATGGTVVAVDDGDLF